MEGTREGRFTVGGRELRTKEEITDATFARFMDKTNRILNDMALEKGRSWFLGKGGNKMEPIVEAGLNKAAYGTPFEGSIRLISGHKFPDLKVDGKYGVEVKSRDSDTWITEGGSVQETTRLEEVKRIYVTFANLGGDPVRFVSRPFEDVISSISVTHSPRYDIDMKLASGKTIFDQMGISYDEFRLKEDPATEFVRYKRRHLQPGEMTWWLSDNDLSAVHPGTIKSWDSLDAEQKRTFHVMGMAYFPKVFCSDFMGFATWLLIKYGYLNYHIRDGFTAGLKPNEPGEWPTGPGEHKVRVSHIVARALKWSEDIKRVLRSEDPSVIHAQWESDGIPKDAYSFQHYSRSGMSYEGDIVEQWLNIVENFIRLSEIKKTGYGNCCDVQKCLEYKFVDGKRTTQTYTARKVN